MAYALDRHGDPAAATPAPPEPAPRDLLEIRAAIDDIDRAIVDLIHDRLDLARRAFDAKNDSGRPLRDLEREAEVIRRASERARARGVEPEQVRDVFWRLIALSHHENGRPPRPDGRP